MYNLHLFKTQNKKRKNPVNLDPDHLTIFSRAASFQLSPYKSQFLR